MELLIVLVIAVLAVVLAWRLLEGLVKTAVLAVIVIVAAIYVLGVHH